MGPLLPVPYPAAQVGDDGGQVDVLLLVTLQLILALGQLRLGDLEDVGELLQVSQLGLELPASLRDTRGAAVGKGPEDPAVPEGRVWEMPEASRAKAAAQLTPHARDPSERSRAAPR